MRGKTQAHQESPIMAHSWTSFQSILPKRFEWGHPSHPCWGRKLYMMRASITCWKRIIPEKTNHQNETCFRSDWHMVQLDDHRNEYDNNADMSCSSTKQHDLWCSDQVDGSLFHDDIYVNTLCLQFNQGLSPQHYASLINFTQLLIMNWSKCRNNHRW